MDSMVSDFYREERALGKWLTSAYITTALAEIRYLAPNLPAGLQLGSSDFGSEWQSAQANLLRATLFHKASTLRTRRCVVFH